MKHNQLKSNYGMILIEKERVCNESGI